MENKTETFSSLVVTNLEKEIRKITLVLVVCYFREGPLPDFRLQHRCKQQWRLPDHCKSSQRRAGQRRDN